jgi:glycerophosphoryl diester phosphodiesterase
VNEWIASKAPSQAPLVIGHRGASADAPDNSLAAFALALEHGAIVAERIREHNLGRRTLISSFSPLALLRNRRHSLKDSPLALIRHSSLNKFGHLLVAGGSIILPAPWWMRNI